MKTLLLFILVLIGEIIQAQLVYSKDTLTVFDTVFIKNPIKISLEKYGSRVIIDSNIEIEDLLRQIDTNNSKRSYKKIYKKYHALRYMSIPNVFLWEIEADINFNKTELNIIKHVELGGITITQYEPCYAAEFHIKKKFYYSIRQINRNYKNLFYYYWYKSRLYRKSQFGYYKYTILAKEVVPAPPVPEHIKKAKKERREKELLNGTK